MPRIPTLSEQKRAIKRLNANDWRLLYDCRDVPATRAEVVPLLAQLLASSDESIRQDAITAVGRIGCCDRKGALRGVVKPLAALCTGPPSITQLMALSVLSIVAADAPNVAVPTLIAAATDEERTVIALQGIEQAKTPSAEAAEFCRRLASSRRAKLRVLAIRALAAIQMPAKQLRPLLETAAKDRSAEVRKVAVRLIAQIES